MRSSGFMLITWVTVLVLAPVIAMANGFYGPSVGVRAGAMGGAFIGLADDYSAVFWNPAGITQIKGMELTASGQDVLSLASRDGFIEFDGDGTAPADRFALGSIAVTSDARNLLAPGVFFYTDPGPLRGIVDKVGITAYTLGDYGSLWNGGEVIDGFIGHQDNFDFVYFAADVPDYESRVKTYVISPVVAREVMPGLSVGLTANIAYSHLTLHDVLIVETAYPIDTPEEEDDWLLELLPFRLSDDVTAWGYGATLGVLYRANSQISVGATVRSPMTMSFEGTYGMTASGGYLPEDIAWKFASDFEMRYPMWAGAGMAYRDFIFDGLLFTADLQWTDWSTFEEIQRNVDWSYPFTGEDMFGFERTDLLWEDTITFAMGFDYRLNRSLSVNLGYRSEPSPTPDETFNFMMPQTDKSVVSVGASYRHDFWRAAFALEYQASETLRFSDQGDMNGKHLEDRLVPMLSLTYAF
jgi:long-chain fatty acid transport protein